MHGVICRSKTEAVTIDSVASRVSEKRSSEPRVSGAVNRDVGLVNDMGCGAENGD